MEDNYFHYLNIDLLIEITTRFDENEDIKSLSNVTNTWDDPIFWKRLVLKRYPKRYRRDYDYKTLHWYLVEYNNNNIILNPKLASFLVFEDIVSPDVQKDYQTVEVLIKNNDIVAVKKILNENPDMVNKYNWYRMSSEALNTENLITINEILKYYIQIEGREYLDDLFSGYVIGVGDNIPDVMIEYIMNYPGVDKISLVLGMTMRRMKFDRLSSITKKYNIEFNDIGDLFGWFERSTFDDKVRTLKYIIIIYRKLFDDKENVDKFLNYTFDLIEEDEYGDIKKDIMGIIYSLPVLRKEYPEFNYNLNENES